MRFTFPHSHAFDGGRLTIEEDGSQGASCLIEFSDGVTIIGELAPTVHGYELRVPLYRTAKGTDVAARTWRIEQSADGTWRSRRLN